MGQERFCEQYRISDLAEPFSLDGPIPHYQYVVLNSNGEIDPNVCITRRKLELALQSRPSIFFSIPFSEMTLWTDPQGEKVLHYHLKLLPIADDDSREKLKEFLKSFGPSERARLVATLAMNVNPYCSTSAHGMELGIGNIPIFGITEKGLYANEDVVPTPDFSSLNTYHQWRKEGKTAYRSWLDFGDEKYFEVLAGKMKRKPSSRQPNTLLFISGVRFKSLFLPEIDKEITSLIEADNLPGIRQVVTPYIRAVWL